MSTITTTLGLVLLTVAAQGASSPLEKARDTEDRAALQKFASSYEAAAQKAPKDAAAQYRVALAYSYLSEVAQEVHDKGGAHAAAEAGVKAAERAVSLDSGKAEYFRVLSTLCGQVIPGNVFSAISYGKRSKDAIAKAKQLDPRSAEVAIAEGVGDYYMPAAFGGGAEIAIKSLRRAVELDPKSAEAYLWLGMALRKAGHNADARQALTRSIDLNPDRVWTKQQLEKTPAQ